jgi:hypothetical protein
MSKVSEALDSWLEARRAVEVATPWTAEWVRARLIASDLRDSYESAAGDETGIRADARDAERWASRPRADVLR